MEIRNKEHARNMLLEWQKLPVAAQKRKIRIAIEKMELSAMYYEQKGNNKGFERMNECINILTSYFDSID